jgi:hypothetical protein
MKICTKCKFDYPAPLEEYFSKKSCTKDGFQYQCKKCWTDAHKEHYKENKTYYKKKARKHNAEYRLRNLQYMVDYLKEHSCVDCGENNPILLDFDHVRGTKITNVSRMVSLNPNLEVIKAEIEKCEVRCVKCHRLKTAIQLGWYKGIKL